MKTIHEYPKVIEARELRLSLILQRDAARAELEAAVAKRNKPKAPFEGGVEGIRRFVADETATTLEEEITRLSEKLARLEKAVRLADGEVLQAEGEAGAEVLAAFQPRRRELRAKTIKALDALVACLTAEDALVDDMVDAGAGNAARGEVELGLGPVTSSNLRDVSRERTRELQREQLLASPSDGKTRRVRFLADRTIAGEKYRIGTTHDIDSKEAALAVLDLQAEWSGDAVTFEQKVRKAAAAIADDIGELVG